MQVLTVRATEEIVEAVEKIVLDENKNTMNRSRFDPKEVGRSGVLRHLIALGLDAYEVEKKKRAAR